MAGPQSSQIPPPKSWSEFETLCCDIWRKVWSDPSASKNGRSGQKQNGIDIIGSPKDSPGDYYAVQCKGKDSYTQSILTEKELEDEVKKAKNFSTKIKVLIIATTSPKDVGIEQRAREITADNLKNDLFSVHVFGWEDIVSTLALYEDVMNLHYNWIINPNDPNKLLFDFWFKEVEVTHLQNNANVIPFRSADIFYKDKFIYKLRSYLSKFSPYADQAQIAKADANLKMALINFNQVVRDILLQHNESSSELDDNYLFWRHRVDLKDLEYHRQGPYIEYKTWVLRSLFYHLVQAANFVILTRNNNLSLNEAHIDFVVWTHFVGTYLGPDRTHDDFLQYDQSQIDSGDLYPGLKEIENNIKSQINGLVIPS